MNDFFYWIGFVFCCVSGFLALFYIVCNSIWYCLKLATWSKLVILFFWYRQQFTKWVKANKKGEAFE